MNQDLRSLEAIATEALTSGDLGAAVKAREAASKLRERIAEREATVVAASTKDEVKRLRLLAQAASIAGSFVAAAGYDKRASELEDRRAAAEAERQRQAAAAQGSGDIVARLIETINRLPPKLRAQVLAGLKT